MAAQHPAGAGTFTCFNPDCCQHGSMRPARRRLSTAACCLRSAQDKHTHQLCLYHRHTQPTAAGAGGPCGSGGGGGGVVWAFVNMLLDNGIPAPGSEVCSICFNGLRRATAGASVTCGVAGVLHTPTCTSPTPVLEIGSRPTHQHSPSKGHAREVQGHPHSQEGRGEGPPGRTQGGTAPPQEA